MKKLIASMIAVAFLLTGSMVAANAGSTKATSTARPAMSTHVSHKPTAKKLTGKHNPKNAKAAKSHKPGKPTQGKKPTNKTAGK